MKSPSLLSLSSQLDDELPHIGEKWRNKMPDHLASAIKSGNLRQVSGILPSGDSVEINALRQFKNRAQMD